MTKLEAIIRPEKLEGLRQDLEELGLGGLTITQVQGAGSEERSEDWFRGLQFTPRYLPKVKVELLLPDAMVEEVIWTIRNACFTGAVGDGKIFIIKVRDAIRVRTGDRGHSAL
jgi:nitrogen regulatory protein P-II 1